MSKYEFINDRGIINADTSSIIEEVKDEFRAIFGEEIDMSPETIQGVIATMLAEQRDNTMRAAVEIANQINPDISHGVFLDALTNWMGGKRNPATYTVINDVEMRGKAGTIIPQGSIATSNGNKFALTLTQILDKDGKAIGDFKAVEIGAIPAPPNSLDKVASSVLGWESVSNPKQGIVGKEEETDDGLRMRRERILGLQGVGEVENIISGLFSVPEVHSLSFYENRTEKPVVVDGITIKPHGLYTCIHGGADSDIARMFGRKKNIGSSMTGDKKVVVKDEITDKDSEYFFSRPKQIPIFIRATVQDSSINAREIVPDIVHRWSEGKIAVDVGLTVARSVSPFEIASAINSEQPMLFVRNVELSKDGKTWSSTTLSCKINEIFTLGSGAVSVVIV